MSKAKDLLEKLTAEGTVSNLGPIPSSPGPRKVIVPRLAGVGKPTVLCPVCHLGVDDCECKTNRVDRGGNEY